ncbi:MULTISPECIES: single-stranded-DNA-specific exonuclease RecJ [unclassified Nitratiruptor]|uniref:single-stranded-DNA-specific exonuclease RecJ n=1 Tax=unclassified Nitratiruptor TaxID=2624044 RepID=UPI00191546EC|nr:MULTISPECIES: single-stranded-DNA-specific exonuclease RecJ [unclassified Nitratiruptor]BCD59424.1 single-stranded-DNA-specific exonuclease [Nitratiruptor sp. YY08-10]BCD63348.1 single-stranded-DNA-specific exonuclease [Nitratiruptor sp. YY08-14]
MRVLTKQDVLRLLQERFQEGFVKLSSLPHPSTLKDMQKASLRIVDAIKKGEKIAVVGDYDVDGVVSTALMKEFFHLLEYPVVAKIPNRFKHGYGLSPKIIEELGDVDLIITVDNGISAHEAAMLCKEKGIDLIITDHHTPPKTLPPAYAIVNPKQEQCSFAYTEICGAQVAWFLIGQLKQDLGLDVDMKQFLDILAVAIIADVMPLRHINRSLVQAGLKMFERSERPAVAYLRSVLKKHTFHSEDIGFTIAPIINSAGRMEDADLALKFLNAKDFFEASVYYARLLSLNVQRKEEERRVLQESLEQVGDERVIVVAGEDWNEGVVGIVASRLVDRFSRPAIVLTRDKNGSYKGSGRSVGAVDLYRLLEGTSHYLTRFGGHKKAAGLGLKKEHLQPFKESINALAQEIPQEDFIETSTVLGELPLSEIDWELIDILESFAPYGESNPVPKFFASNVEVLEKRGVGEDGRHLLMTLRQNGNIFKAIHFHNATELQNDRIDIVYQPVKNIYNNSIYIQLHIKKIV